MATIANRLEKLEQTAKHAERRVISIITYGHSKSEIDEFLISSGIEMGPNDLLLNTCIVYPSGEINPENKPISLG